MFHVLSRDEIEFPYRRRRRARRSRDRPHRAGQPGIGRARLSPGRRGVPRALARACGGVRHRLHARHHRHAARRHAARLSVEAAQSRLAMIAWLNPAAFAGLALLAGPVLVHLLLRHRAERVLFPSLRFVRPSRTAAVRLRLPSDLALLLLRMAIVAVAVAAARATAAARAVRGCARGMREWRGPLSSTSATAIDSPNDARSAGRRGAVSERRQGRESGNGLRRADRRAGARIGRAAGDPARWPRRLRPGARSSSSPASSAARCRARISTPCRRR